MPKIAIKNGKKRKPRGSIRRLMKLGFVKKGGVWMQAPVRTDRPHYQ